MLTEHQGIGVHEDEWLPGTVGDCPLCQAALAEIMARHQGGKMKKVNFNINRLKHDNAGHYTQAMLGRDVIEAAKKDGREIARARQ